MSKRTVVIGAVAAVAAIGLLLWSLRPTNRTDVAASLTPGAVTSAAPSPVAPPDPLLQKLDEIVARYRKTVVLLEEGDSLPDADRERASLVGKIIFQENHQAIAALSDTLTDEIE